MGSGSSEIEEHGIGCKPYRFSLGLIDAEVFFGSVRGLCNYSVARPCSGIKVIYLFKQSLIAKPVLMRSIEWQLTVATEHRVKEIQNYYRGKYSEYYLPCAVWAFSLYFTGSSVDNNLENLLAKSVCTGVHR